MESICSSVLRGSVIYNTEKSKLVEHTFFSQAICVEIQNLEWEVLLPNPFPNPPPIIQWLSLYISVVCLWVGSWEKIRHACARVCDDQVETKLYFLQCICHANDIRCVNVYSTWGVSNTLPLVCDMPFLNQYKPDYFSYYQATIGPCWPVLADLTLKGTPVFWTIDTGLHVWRWALMIYCGMHAAGYGYARRSYLGWC